jgi:ATP-dependent DNA helicase RecQ
MLLAYFDEPNAAKCGVCDVCLAEKRQKNAAEIFENITNEIVQLLSIDNYTIGELITTLKLGTEKEKIETLRMLLDAGKIKTDGEKYYL